MRSSNPQAISTPSIIKRHLEEQPLQKSLKKFNYKPSHKGKGHPLKFRDFDTYRKQKKSKAKKEMKMGSRLLKEGSTGRRSFDGRKSLNFTKDDHFRVTHDDSLKSRQKENV